MTKTMKRFFAILLALALVFFVPVIAAAEGSFSFNSYEIKAASGKWEDDYVGKVRVTLKGDATAFGDSDTILTVSVGENTLAEIKKSDASVSFSNGNTVIEFALNKKLIHSDEIVFEVKENAFKSADDSTNEAYSFSVSGNYLIESIDIEEIAVNPIEKLIIKINEWKYGWMLYPVVLILRFFLSL